MVSENESILKFSRDQPREDLTGLAVENPKKKPQNPLKDPVALGQQFEVKELASAGDGWARRISALRGSQPLLFAFRFCIGDALLELGFAGSSRSVIKLLLGDGLLEHPLVHTGSLQHRLLTRNLRSRIAHRCCEAHGSAGDRCKPA